MYRIAMLSFVLTATALAQTAQVGADISQQSSRVLEAEYVHYRPAVWETEKVTEYESEFPNEGGLVYVYLRNTSDKPVSLRYWRVNGKDQSYWRLNGFVPWDRTFNEGAQPGELAILEINAKTADFGRGTEMRFEYMDRTWGPAVRFTAPLEPDPVRISFIRVHEDMKTLDVFVRYGGEAHVTFGAPQVEGKSITSSRWAVDALDGAGMTIVRLELDTPFAPSELVVPSIEVRAGDTVRRVYAHRRAFPDAFPIGAWSGEADTFAHQRRIHIDTLVKGGSADNAFFTEHAPKYDLYAMTHTDIPIGVDQIRSLSGHPRVRCWMLIDEPDWHTPSNIVAHADRAVRREDKTKPTFVTLCRNTKFFEYAPIADIACQDHYSVTAPSSSKWPAPYGTRLEETAYYTRDLKEAAEPKPIWVWTQGIAGWGERPKRPVPTPGELAAQLVLNLGRGSKGILWFNYDKDRLKTYPDVGEAMQRWGRVMRLLREPILGAEPYDTGLRPVDGVDVAALAGWEHLLLFLTNMNYEIDPEAYPFEAHEDVRIRIKAPDWIAPEAAYAVTPDGILLTPMQARRGWLTITVPYLEEAMVLAVGTHAQREALQSAYDEVLADEERVFDAR